MGRVKIPTKPSKVRTPNRRLKVTKGNAFAGRFA